MSCETNDMTTKWELYLKALALHFDKQGNDLLERRGMTREDAQHNHRARRDRSHRKKHGNGSNSHHSNSLYASASNHNNNNNNNNNNSNNNNQSKSSSENGGKPDSVRHSNSSNENATNIDTLSATHAHHSHSKLDRKGVISPIGGGFDDTPVKPMSDAKFGNDGKRIAQHFKFEHNENKSNMSSNNNNNNNDEIMSPSQKLKYKPTIIVGPSGVGKGTLLNELMRQFASVFSKAVSHTTRKARNGEIQGQDYFFVTKEEFETLIAKSEFIEFANVHGNYYGTSKRAILDVAKQNQICLMEIDYEGAINVNDSIDAHFMFITCKNGLSQLKERMKLRGTESDEEIKNRLETAKKEIEFYQHNKEFFDFVLFNDDLEVALNNLKNQFVEWYPWIQENSMNINNNNSTNGSNTNANNTNTNGNGSQPFQFQDEPADDEKQE